MAKFSVVKLTSHNPEEQQEEFARLFPALSTLGCVLLTDFPDFAKQFYREFAERSQQNMDSNVFPNVPSKREIEQGSYLYSLEGIPYCGKSRRFVRFAGELVEHITDVTQSAFLGPASADHPLYKRKEPLTNGAFTYMKSLPKRMLRQGGHLDGSILTLVTPVLQVQDEKRENYVSNNLGLQCFNIDHNKFEQVQLHPGDMVLLAGRGALKMTRTWIVPCPHRVITQACQASRMSMVCSSSFGDNLHRKDADLCDFDKHGRRPGVPMEVQKRLAENKSMWEEASQRVQNYKWLQPSSVNDTYVTLVDVMAEEVDDFKVLELD